MDIKAQYKHSKAGTFLFDLCAKWTKLLLKHRWLYYVMAFTWGSVMTTVGAIITVLAFIAQIWNLTIAFNSYLWIYSIKFGPDYWGGFDAGLVFVRDQSSEDSYINPHEFGHTFQNALLGPFFLFIVAIPSMTRYWYQEFRCRKGKDNVDYDAIWFEDSATKCGEYAEWYINSKEAK